MTRIEPGWVAYVGPVPFPDGSAASRRILGNAHAIAGTGRSVVVVSGGRYDQPEPQFVAPGVSMVSIRERHSEDRRSLLKYALYARMGRRSRDWVDSMQPHPSAIILYSGYAPYLLQFTDWARARGIPLIFDAVEWYAARSKLGFAFSPYLWSTELAMRWLIPRTDGVFAISKSLEKYYTNRGLPALRVPPLVKLGQVLERAARPIRPLIVTYAGSPGQKDLLDPIVRAVLALDQRGERITLNVAGMNEAEARSLPAIKALRIRSHEDLPDSIRVQGYLSPADAVALVSSSHFSVFIRDVNRVSTYGFPTKFVESLSLGTPVITNLTSDLALHLRNRENGLICSDPTAAAVESVLSDALMLGPEQWLSMSHNAFSEAKRSFDVEQYITQFDGFFNHLNIRHKE